MLLIPQRYNFSSKSQPLTWNLMILIRCCWYHKGTIFQANHNSEAEFCSCTDVVVDTTKVQFFKQITTTDVKLDDTYSLLLIPQRYNFSSKSQHNRYKPLGYSGCCWYHKGTIFQANHNKTISGKQDFKVVVDTTKVQFFKQITTMWSFLYIIRCCCWYHKGTIFQANHN